MKITLSSLRRAAALGLAAFAMTLAEPSAFAKNGADDGANHDATEHVGGDDHGGASSSGGSKKSGKKGKRHSSHHHGSKHK